MTALLSVATETEKTQDTAPYLMLPENSSGNLYHFVFRRANIVGSTTVGDTPLIADIAVNTDRRRAGFTAPSLIRSIGDLTRARGLEEYDVSGFNVVQRLGSLKIGDLAEFYFYRKDRVVDWTATDLEKQYPPDAIFSLGKWIKGEKLVAKK
jgi:hypothetical protein